MNISDQKVSILGTGNFGVLIYNILSDNGIRVDRFIDINPKNHGKGLCGLPICSIQDLTSTEVVYLASNRNNHAYLRESCTKVSSDVVFPALHEIVEKHRGELRALTWDSQRCRAEVANYLSLYKISSLSYRSLDIVLTEKCTLKCRDCSNLMQYYNSPKNVELANIIKSLEFIKNSGVAFQELRIIGGEPLIHRELDEVLAFIKKSTHDSRVVLFTNGTIIPRPSTIQLLKECATRVQISKYRANLSRNWEGLVKVLKLAEVEFTLEDVVSWNDCGQVVNVTTSNENVAKTFSNCCVNDALTLLHGRLYGCPFSSHFHNLNQSSGDFEVDWIDLSGIYPENLGEEIQKLLNVKYYLACRSCKGRDYESAAIPAAVQVKNPLIFQRKRYVYQN